MYRKIAFYFAVGLFMYRSQNMSKCGKDISDTRLHLMFHFSWSYHILVSSMMYYWTAAQLHGIYLLNWKYVWIPIQNWKSQPYQNNYIGHLLPVQCQQQDEPMKRQGWTCNWNQHANQVVIGFVFELLK